VSEPVRVLLCDDVAMLRELLRYELEEDADVRVVGEAGDGAEGVRMVHDLKPDVVVLDLAMPDMDGLEAIPMMRTGPNPPEIIVHSGFDAELMRDRVIALGAARYLEKGGMLSGVRSAVRELVDELRARRPGGQQR
jgi:DNA-binding NarL/FixJ family response regulator